MGSCVSTLTLSPDLEASLKVNPDLTTLLILQLHYSCYDPVSQKKIDALSMVALKTDNSIHFTNKSSELRSDKVEEVEQQK